MEAMFDALLLLLQPQTLLYLLIGVCAGLLVGIIPGLGGPSGIAVVLPFALFLEPLQGISLILGLSAATSGIDSVPAILFAIPGTAGSQATVLDGHPLARKGEAGRAFGAAYMSSLLGGLFGAVILTAIIPVARPLVLAVGSPELLMLALLGIVMTASLSGRSVGKGLLAGCAGLLISMMGVEGSSATLRWWFGSLYLYDGVPLTLIALGIFALPEIIDLIIRGTQISDKGILVQGSVMQGVRDTFRHWFLVLRTSGLGTFMGAVPGLGGSVIDWFAYGHARATERGASETFGKGDIRGVIGVDAAVNAKDGGSLIPTLLFGVPGTVSMALLLTVFVVHGIQPGPAMVTTHLQLTLAMVWIIVLSNVFAAVGCLLMAGTIARVALIPANIVGPLVVVAVAFAAINASRSIWDIAGLMALTVLGWSMKRMRWPRPPLVIGFVLGPIIERYMLISISRYSLDWLLRPGVLVIAVVMVLVTTADYWLKARRKGETDAKVGS